jgi:hypothetical protein
VLTGTSLCLLRPDAASPTLHLYGVTDRGIYTGLDSSYTGTELASGGRLAAAACSSLPDGQGYLVGDHRPRGETFRVLSFADTAVEPIRTCCVPGQRTGDATSGEAVTVVDWDTGTRSISYVGGLRVIYKDPHVLYLSSISKWIMLLSRTRSLTGMSSPHECVSDIVAFTADDAGFTTSVVGPFFLASSLAPYDGVHYRLFLSVPGGIEVDFLGVPTLFLYYVVEPADIATAGLGETGTYPGSAFEGGIAMWRIETSHFSLTPPDEVDWDSTTTPESYALLYTYSGRARFWFATSSATYDVVAFEDTYTDAKPVDPFPISTSAAGAVLFFAALVHSRASVSVAGGHGVWRASIVGTDTTSVALYDTYNGVTVSSEYGIDWVLRAGLSDQVFPSRSDTATALDPSAAQSFFGYWFVILSLGDPSGTMTPLRFLAPNAEVDIYYDDCW